ncbi:30S ribosomal protein S21 [Aestuariivivens sediminicola]|uniref:30S ribosomal protein S21 n=1 Tax=Aestuariivivens sediminicola TaxID=2913560 RepID=UPI001F565671|nr:30S ribosomal protein S21 [Aestuariivivens sediminicola]
MLIINVIPGEKIERAIKRLRLKVRNTKQHKQLKDNKFFTKKSTKKREEIAKAKYKELYERSQEI